MSAMALRDTMSSPTIRGRGTLARLRAVRQAAADVIAGGDESDVVWQARGGSGEAFAELYRRHQPTIARYVMTRVRNTSEAEDLTEAIFESAWKAMGRYKEQGVPFLAWLYRLAHNRVIDHYRAQRVVFSLIPEVHETLLESEDTLEHNLNGTDLAEALALLTEDQRQVILLRFVQGMNGREVAQAMAKREDAVRALQFRAIATLRRILNEGAHSGDSTDAG